jgi:hypothetical protein
VPPGTSDVVMAQTGTEKKKKNGIVFHDNILSDRLLIAAVLNLFLSTYPLISM